MRDGQRVPGCVRFSVVPSVRPVPPRLTLPCPRTTIRPSHPSYTRPCSTPRKHRIATTHVAGVSTCKARSVYLDGDGTSTLTGRGYQAPPTWNCGPVALTCACCSLASTDIVLSTSPYCASRCSQDPEQSLRSSPRTMAIPYDTNFRPARCLLDTAVVYMIVLCTTEVTSSTGTVYDSPTLCEAESRTLLS